MLESIKSSYLVDGYKEDILKLVDYEYKKNDRGFGQLSFELEVESFSIPSDGVFHLSAITAEVWIQQATIVLAHLDNNLPKKKTEVYLLERSTKYKKVISSKKISLIVQIIKQRKVKSNIFYTASISINGDSFTGDGKFIFQLPEQNN